MLDITAYYHETGDFGHFKSSFIVRKLGFEIAKRSDETLGWDVYLSGSYQLSTQNNVKYQCVHGAGISRYINEPCCSYLTAITATNGFVYLDHQLHDDLS